MQRRWPVILCVTLATAVGGWLTFADAQAPSGAQAGAAGGKPTFEQDVSYAIGLTMGRDLVQNEVPVDPQHLVAGIMDALRKAKPRLSDEQMTAVMTRFDQIMQQKAGKRMASAMEENKKKGAAFLAENGKKDGIQTTASGLQYKVVEEGTGATPTAQSTVSCHYEGTLIGGEVFDSSYRRGQPAQFPVGGVIGGWTEMLQLMKEGGKVEVYIPSDLAYGDRGSAPVIGPGETLIFTIELLKVM